MIPSSLRHLRSIRSIRSIPGHRFVPDPIDPAELRIGPGAPLPIAGHLEPRACQPLTLMGWELDAVQWDWPRWGRRILVSGDIPLAIRQATLNRLSAEKRAWRLTFGQDSNVVFGTGALEAQRPLRRFPRFVWDERDEVIREDA